MYWLQRLLSWGLASLPTLLILGLLGVIGWWGGAHDWKWTEPTKKEEPKEDLPTIPEGENAKLPSIELAKEAPEGAGLQSARAQVHILGEYVTANGQIDYDEHRYAHLTARLAGIVWSVEKLPGDAVRQGDLLALIASAELARLKNDYQASLYQHEQRQRLYERRKLATSAIPGEQIVDAALALRDAKIRMLNAQQSLENLGLHVNTNELSKLGEEEISEHLRLVGIPREIIEREGKSRITSNLLPMRAPFDGEVIERDMVLGEMVTPGPPHFVVADLSHVRVRLYVRQEDQGKMEKGLTVRFLQNGVSDELPEGKAARFSAEVEGKVVRISAEVDARTRTLPVLAEVDNAQHRLRPNTFGVGRIRIGEHSAVTVPNNAVQWDGQGHVVFVKESETVYQPRRVTIGQQEWIKEGEKKKDVTEIRSGIRAGETVVTEGSHVLLGEMLKARISGED